MLGVQNPASVAVFGSMKNHRAQRDALSAAATHSLQGEVLNLFEAILAVHRQLDGQRNDVVHGMWGDMPDHPDTALWMSTQDYSNHLIRVYAQDRQGNSAAFEAETARLTSRCFIWPLSDLEKLNQEINELSETIMSFHVHLRYSQRLGGDSALQRLRNAPLIQRELARSKSATDTPP